MIQMRFQSKEDRYAKTKSRASTDDAKMHTAEMTTKCSVTKAIENCCLAAGLASAPALSDR